MYNLRYHIASLVGVFLALSIGLLLGTVVAERGTLDDQRDALINSLERDFADLSQSNQQLSAENEALLEFESDVVPVLITGTLSGRTVAVLTNAGRSDGTAAVQDTIKAAGGTPVTLVIEQAGMGLDDAEVLAAVKPVVGAKTDDVQAAVASALASEWTTVGPRPVTDALVSAGVLRASELDADAIVDSIAFTAAWDQEPDPAAVRIGEAFTDKGRRAVGAQAVSLDSGVAVAALNADLDAADQMGRPVGSYALAWLLSGRASGFYGAGSGARALYPQP